MGGRGFRSALLAPLVLACCAGGAMGVAELRMDAALVTGGTSSLCVPGRWCQVSVEIRNSGPSFQGEIVVYPAGPFGTAYRQPVPVLQGQRRIAIPFLPTAVVNSYRVSLLDAASGSPMVAPQSLTIGSTLQRVVIACPGNTGLDEVSQRLEGASRIEVVQTGPDWFPDRWLGWDSAQFVVLTPVSYDRLSAAQWDALRQWVWLGGELVVVTGASPELFRAPPLAALLPVTLEGATRLTSLGTLAAAPVSEPIEGTLATLRPGIGETLAAGRTLDGRAAPIVARRPFGSGRCTFVGVRLDAPPLSLPNTPGREAVWRLVLGQVQTGPAPGFGETYNGPIVGRQEAFEQALTPKAARPLSAWLLLLFGLAYIIAVGPAAYLALRRRRSMAAGTVYGILALGGASLLAYAMSMSSKSSAYQENEVIVDDVCLAEGWTHRYALASFFLPDEASQHVAAAGERTYLGVPGAPPLAGPGAAAGRFLSAVTQTGTDPAYDFDSLLFSTRAVCTRSLAPLPPEAGLDALTRLRWYVDNNRDLFAATYLIRGKQVFALGPLTSAALAPGEDGRIRLGGSPSGTTEPLPWLIKQTWDTWPFSDARCALALSVAPVEARGALRHLPGLARLSLLPALERPGGAALVAAVSGGEAAARLDRPGATSQRVRTVRILLPPEISGLLR